MKKKILLFTLLAVLSLTSISLASNIGQDLKNMGNDAGKAVQDTASNIKSGVRNIGNNVGGELKNSGNKIQTETNSNMGMTNPINNATSEVKNSGAKISGEVKNAPNAGYTATRTATTNNATGLMGNRNFWTWATIILVAIGVIAMIWYYFSAKSEYDNHH